MNTKTIFCICMIALVNSQISEQSLTNKQLKNIRRQNELIKPLAENRYTYPVKTTKIYTYEDSCEILRDRLRNDTDKFFATNKQKNSYYYENLYSILVGMNNLINAPTTDKDIVQKVNKLAFKDNSNYMTETGKTLYELFECKIPTGDMYLKNRPRFNVKIKLNEYFLKLINIHITSYVNDATTISPMFDGTYRKDEPLSVGTKRGKLYLTMKPLIFSTTEIPQLNETIVQLYNNLLNNEAIERQIQTRNELLNTNHKINILDEFPTTTEIPKLNQSIVPVYNNLLATENAERQQLLELEAKKHSKINLSAIFPTATPPPPQNASIMFSLNERLANEGAERAASSKSLVDNMKRLVAEREAREALQKIENDRLKNLNLIENQRVNSLIQDANVRTISLTTTEPITETTEPITETTEPITETTEPITETTEPITETTEPITEETTNVVFETEDTEELTEDLYE